MLSGRLYRAAFLPSLFALAIAAFSLSVRPNAPVSTLAPDAFDGERAFAELNAMAGEFPQRRPGGAGDRALAAHITRSLQALGGAARGGFNVRTRRFTAATTEGRRTLTTVVAERPGSTGAPALMVLAHRDSRGGAPARAELSGTAGLLELARVFASRETRRTIILASTSGGGDGAAGAQDLAAHSKEIRLHAPLDAAIVLGDIAGPRVGRPVIVPFSDGFGSAPPVLQRTVGDAIGREAGGDAGSPSLPAQLAHLAFQLTVGEQGPLNAAGIPAVLVQVSGERGPSSGERVSAARLESMGRSVLAALDALDTGADVPSTPQTGLVVQRMTIPSWAVRLVVGALLLPPLVTLADGVARARRRRSADRSLRRATAWALAWALPFAVAALFARLLGVSEVIGAVPSGPLAPSAVSLDATAIGAVLSATVVFGLGWLARRGLMHRLGLAGPPDQGVAGLAVALVLLAACVAVWIDDPYTALVLLPAAHLLLLVASPELRPRLAAALGVVAIAMLPAALLGAFYVDQLGLSPDRAAWMALALLAGGHVGIPAAMLWSIVCGCVVAALIVAAAQRSVAPEGGEHDRERITIRGPLSYAGPGSLGGTESALRR